MFEKQHIEINIEDKILVIYELDYVQEAEFGIILQRLLTNESKVDELIEIDADGNRTVNEDNFIAMKKIEVENRKIVLDAYQIPVMTIDDEIVESPEMILKKLGHIQSVGLMYRIYGIGRLTEEEKKK